MIEMNPQATALHTLTDHLKRYHLKELAIENLRLLREFDVPLMQIVAHMADDELVQLTMAGLETFLTDLGAGRALEAYREQLRLWEADELPGVPRDIVEPPDMVLVYAAQKLAILKHAGAVTQDPQALLAMICALEDYYVKAQNEALLIFDKLRADAAQRAVRLEAERQAALEVAEQLRAANEEQASQAEELQSQQEELNALYDELRRHADHVEALVADRTQELQAANEELAAQTEELIRANDEVLEQKALVESVVGHAPAGVVFLDRDFTVRWINPEFVRLIGGSAETLLGKHFLDRASGEVRAGMQQVLDGVLASGETYRADAFPYVLNDRGTPRETFWDFSYVPVHGRHGQADGILVFALEVSSRVENERLQHERIEALQQQDRYKDEFISVISHELRTPLNFIMGFASLLEDEVPGPLNELQGQHIQKILQGADRMLLLVDDLLDFARIQAGSFSLAPELAAFDSLVENTVGSVRPLAEQKGLTLETVVEPGIQATVDVQRVTQVLTNLLSNAIKFTDQGGSVRVRAFIEDGWVVAEVADTGVGIAEADLPKLFQRFRQLDMSATRKVGGTGLGLSITKSLVEAHGGSVHVESRMGAGSTFSVRLPR